MPLRRRQLLIVLAGGGLALAIVVARLLVWRVTKGGRVVVFE